MSRARGVGPRLVALVWLVVSAGCTAVVTGPEPADVDFVIGAYARAADGYERMLVMNSSHEGRDRIRFRLALSYLLAAPHGRDVDRARTILGILGRDPEAEPELRLAARLLLAAEDERIALRRQLEQQIADAAVVAEALNEELECARAAWHACGQSNEKTTQQAQQELVSRNREISRLEQELTRLAETLQRFTEIDTEPDDGRR